MNKPVAELFEQARKLSAEEREELAELLLASVEPFTAPDEALGKEADRRWQEHLRSGEDTLDGFEVLEEARQVLKNDRARKAGQKEP